MFVDSSRSYSVASTTELLPFADVPSHFTIGGAFQSSLDITAPSGEPSATLILDDDHA